MCGPLLHPTIKMRPVEAGMRPATAVLSCGARDGVSLGCSRPCALACLGMRRATAAGGPQRYRRRRNSIGAGRCSAAPSGLPRVPPIAVLLGLLTLSRLGAPRTAALSSAASASVGRRSSPLVAVVSHASPCRAAPCAAMRARRLAALLSRHPLRAGGDRRCAPLPASGRALRPAPSRLPPCAGPGACPGPCRSFLRSIIVPLRSHIIFECVLWVI